MSDHHTTIVDIDVSLADAPAQALRMIQWMQAKGIVSDGVREGALYQAWREGLGRSDRFLPDEESDKIVYPPGPNFQRACISGDAALPFYNWLEIIIERRVFHAGEAGLGILCPACREDQFEAGGNWNDAIEDWHEGGEGTLVCVACAFSAPLASWIFDPVWAFGNLGFQFSNWSSLTDEFVADFRAQLGSTARVVHCWL